MTEFYLSILWAGVQPTLDPYAEAFIAGSAAHCANPGRGGVFGYDVCKCMRDCRVGGLSRREQLVRYL